MALSDQLQFFAATDVGRKRTHNEDNYLVDPDLGLFVVADGMGGHAAGEVASALAVRTLHALVAQERELFEGRGPVGPRSDVSGRQILAMLDRAVQTASQRIHGEARSDPKKRGMGTTMSALLIVGSVAYVAHVGDSRIYLVRNGVMHQVTEDHTVAQELLRLGMVSPEHLDRVPRKNAITRAVGVYQHVETDTLTLELLPKDQFLLCSDGLHGYFDEQRESMTSYLANEDGDAAVASLIGFANDHGGKDNITGILVRVGTGDTSDSQRARRVAMKREMLAALPLFSRLSERELLHIMQVAEVHQLEANEHVVRKGETGEQMFVTLAGSLRVSDGPTVLQRLEPGDHFGEMALIRNMPRSADVVAEVPSEVVSIRRSDFFDIIRAEPHIAVKLLWQFLGVLANRLELTSRDLAAARAELGVAAPGRVWVDDEPSLDPFTTVPPPMYDTEAGYLGNLKGGPQEFPVVDDEALAATIPPELVAAAQVGYVVERRKDAPSFDAAPAMAARRDLESPSPPPASARPRTKLDKQTQILGPDEAFDAKKTLPSLGPSLGRASLGRAPLGQSGRSRAETLPSHGAVPPTQAATREATREATRDATREASLPESREDRPRNDPLAETKPDGTKQDERHATQPLDRPLDASTSEEDPFRPTKVTIPLNPPESLRSELDDLRAEFKERLRKSREARRRKDSD